MAISIIPSPTANLNTKKRLRAFKFEQTDLLSRLEFIEVLSKACDAMNIPAPGETPEDSQFTFSKHLLKIELAGPTRQHLSVIDVPGLFRTPTEGVTTKANKILVQNIVKSYIKDKQTIILAVIPAPAQIATQEILRLAQQVDPLGQRTLGILTKPDLVREGGEGIVMDLLRGTENTLNLGYCIVNNTKSCTHLIKEAEFFSTPPWPTLDEEHVGISALQGRLREILAGITRREFTNVRFEIGKRLRECEQKLESLGPARETDDQQREFLLDLATKFQDMTSHALDAYYSRNSLFHNNSSLRLATRIVDLNTAFSNDVWLKGHTIDFRKSTTVEHSDSRYMLKGLRDDNEEDGESSNEDEESLNEDSEFLNEDEESSNEDKESSNEDEESSNKDSRSSTDESVESDSKYPELLDITSDREPCPEALTGDIFVWIESLYRRSRGFELGSFGTSLLPLLFQEQSEKWDCLALTYISDVILVVHTFMDELLSALCSCQRVKVNLWNFIRDDLLDRYPKAMSHTRFILQVERKSTLLNCYFNEKLMESRLARCRSAMEDKPMIKVKDSSQKMIGLDTFVKSFGKSNKEPTVEDIHAVLESYYKEARKRFVDVMCMQAADHFLVSGPESPLRLFTPSLVHRMSLENLNWIAGEDVGSKRMRGHLLHEIECLKAAKDLLKS